MQTEASTSPHLRYPRTIPQPEDRTKRSFLGVCNLKQLPLQAPSVLYNAFTTPQPDKLSKANLPQAKVTTPRTPSPLPTLSHYLQHSTLYTLPPLQRRSTQETHLPILYLQHECQHTLSLSLLDVTFLSIMLPILHIHLRLGTLKHPNTHTPN